MKKVLILTRNEKRPEFDQKATYAAALADIDAKCDYTLEEFENLLFSYDGNSLKVYLSDGATDIASFEVVLFVGWFKTKMLEDMALSVSLYLKSKQTKVVNTEALYTRSRTKLSQYVYASLNDITITPFLFSMNSAVLQKSLPVFWSNGYPVIMKGVLASRGNDNYLVKDQASAEQIAKMMDGSEDLYFVLQSFVPNTGDYRIIVMGDEVKTIIHRRSQSDSHLNNTSKGGEATLVAPEELPVKVIEDSVKLSKLLRREVTGVDMIQDSNTGIYCLLEINNMPQMATGTNVRYKITQLDEYLYSL
jgi:glutathione synthase/RimK-type ligase-like ATP-grasp enzyme